MTSQETNKESDYHEAIPEKEPPTWFREQNWSRQAIK
jgi:hypothetical protein